MEWLWILLKPLLSWLNKFSQARLGIDRDHDVAIFKKLDAIGTESQIKDILNDRIYTSSFRLEDDHILSDFIDGLSRIETRFLDTTVQKAADEMRDHLADLQSFVRRTFSSIHGGWLKFYPNRIDEDRYNKEWAELCSKIDKSWEAYKSFRMTVKKRLMV